jgi:hypothetical protein
LPLEFNVGMRVTRVMKRRTKKDFALFVKIIIDRYPRVRKLHIVLDILLPVLRDHLKRHLEKNRPNPFCKGLSSIIQRSMPAG